MLVGKLEPEVIHKHVSYNSGHANHKLYFTDINGIILFDEQGLNQFKCIGTLTTTERKALQDSNLYGNISLSSLKYDDVFGYIRNGNQTIDAKSNAYDESESIYASKISDDIPFYLVHIHGDEYVKELSFDFSVLIFFSIIVTILFLIILFYFLLRKILTPLEVITQSALDIQNGNFKPIKVNSTNDEFELLGNVFNQMIFKIFADLEEKDRNITKAKDEFEEQEMTLKNFQFAVEQASDHIVITDPDGKILYANKSAETLTGYSKSEMLGKKAGSKELWGGNMPEELYKKLWNTILIKKEIFYGTLVNNRKGGQEYVAVAAISPVLDKNNNIKFLLGIERDVSEEENLKKTKSELISLASHQLRTPLSSIKWNSELLTDSTLGQLSTQQAEIVESINAKATLMSEIINKLMTASLLDLNKLESNIQKIDLVDLFSEVLKAFNRHIESKHLNVEKNLPQECLYKIDKTNIQFILTSLLSNSVRYTQESGNITISIEKTDDKSVLIKIQDDGYGIPEADKKMVFTKLFRGSNILKYDTEGSGLSLHIVKRILDNIDGSISFESEEEKGTEFTVKLPPQNR